MVDRPRPYDHAILLARAKAFHFNGPPPADLCSAKYLDSAKPGDVVNAVLANAITGDFRYFAKLVALMKRVDDAVIWGDCTLLLAYAAPYSVLDQLIDAFKTSLFESDDIVTQQWISEILCRSGGLRFVPTVLTLFRRNTQRHKYFATPLYLSRMLETTPAAIADGPPILPRTDDLPDWFDVPTVYDDDAYTQTVMARHAEIAAQTPDPHNAAVWAGRPLSLPTIAQNALQDIEAGEDTEDIAIARTWLEAATGEDLSDCYADHLLMNLAAASHIETLLDARVLKTFEPGHRYFFGRKIPQ